MIREVFSSIMGEGKFIGKRFIFVRFKQCPLDCIYCDEPNTPEGMARVEEIPGSGLFTEYLDIDNELIQIIENLRTPDLFAVSFTGGEPLLYSQKIKEYSKILHDKGYKTFLESNGMFPEKLSSYDYASIDIKLPEHFKDCDMEFWHELYRKELETIERLYYAKCNVYAKIVVFEETSVELLEQIARDLSKIGDITLSIQPVTPTGDIIKTVSKKKIFEIMAICGRYVDVICTPQIHKWMGML
ncbi:Radical SAM domain protein [Methanococcus vannielii SB]|uniref:7-carboxy-7-deazaguanine synthase n=1 Tax=Methanococcus vannielii (strain ATCC 35089 / DSM 1224 / JCM 13029 / OCM 148 / SB) TaxID=406327 RepID=A6UR68_METVS|nr:7-carboxy-7-deazaguanine synthase QueE [Methanococcus vannielii]ABR54990.1 Radical SAM domain protein [Methanococcus vannielii SB]